MKCLTTLIFLLVIQSSIFSQEEEPCGNELLEGIAFVNAPSGLNLRSQPTIESEILLTIPFSTEISICDFDNDYSTIDGINGRWVNVTYKGETGYLFSGYLDVISDVSIFFVNDGSVDPFTTENSYTTQGIYETDQSQGYKVQYDVKTIELKNGKLPENELEPKMLISGMEINKEQVHGRIMNKMFFPFESKGIWLENTIPTTQYIAYAKGTGIVNENSFEPNFYNSIKDYELWLRIHKQGEENIDILLYKNDLNNWISSFNGGAWICWVGHLNDDNIPEVIIRQSNHHAGWEYKLFLSDPSLKKLYRSFIVGWGSSC